MASKSDAFWVRYTVFVETWDRLAERGICDAWGGAEWRRVHAAWREAGMLVPCENFIRREANRGPGDGQP